MTLPSFLRSTFDARTLESDPATFAAIDPAGQILWTNAAWRTFAAENGGDPSLRAGSVGASYLTPLGPELGAFYARAFADAIATGTPYSEEYDCPSPSLFRRFRLRALPVGNAGLLLEHRMMVERPREQRAARAFDGRYRNEHGFLVQCAQCRCIRRRDWSTWDWVPGWVAAPPADTSHTICQVCAGFYWGVAA